MYWLTKAAFQRRENAQYILGKIYQKGWGTKRDIGKAMDWYLKAANQGHQKSQIKLNLISKIYIQSGKSEKIFVKARRAAEGNSPSAKYQLALLYLNGIGVKKDYRNAAKWFKASADQNHIAAQYYYGLLLEKGDRKSVV